ncbi:MAG: hypothetical protein ACFFD2_14585 [Promethearchaeota archaeon]
MNNNEKMSNEDLIMFWGFIFLIMGAIGIVNVGFLEGLSNTLIVGIIILIIGIAILVSIAFINKRKSK